ncbi:MAG: tetratricopeptide repeat protein, partial [Planctomycetaceae bacterium]
ELLLGQYPAALESAAAGIERYAWSVRLRQIQYEAAVANGQQDLAAEALAEIEKMVAASSWRYTDADDLVALGRVALVVGADAKAVQQGFYERARKNYSTRPDGFVAAAGLAVEKGDPQMAVDLLEPVMERFGNQPEVLMLMSEALEGGDAQRSSELLQSVLTENPSYYPALLKLADRAIDQEDYSGATGLLDQILQLNEHHPEAHALKSVIAHLENRPEDETAEREAALRFAPKSPIPDFTIGRKLSRKYRFREGAAAQRRALAADSSFSRAKAQLAEDLLRLGNEDEGWNLAEEAADEDPYNATLFNLLQLRDSLDRFVLLSSDHFEVRMESAEARIYGPTVLELLERAWDEATVRYEFVPQIPVRVEIYPRVDDFAVRTFGIPDVAGFLGVCFGQVITANSPASRRDTPSDWQSVLWHEF